MKHLDVKTTFYNSDLVDKVYMTQLQGFEVLGREHQVCRFFRTIYGLKHAFQAWYTNIDHFLRQHGLMKNEVDHNLYYKNSNTIVVIFVLYVDDLLLTWSDAAMLINIELQLEEQFKMSKLG
jgi:hypothetical protein